MPWSVNRGRDDSLTEELKSTQHSLQLLLETNKLMQHTFNTDEQRREHQAVLEEVEAKKKELEEKIQNLTQQIEEKKNKKKKN